MTDWNPQETPAFSPSEMGCKCGKCDGSAHMQHEFMLKLQEMRDLIGPLTVTSGYRCAEHPSEKRKDKPGAHNQGRAADISVGDALDRYNVLNHATDCGMVGLGVAKSFIHIDDGHAHARRPAAWTYS